MVTDRHSGQFLVHPVVQCWTGPLWTATERSELRQRTDNVKISCPHTNGLFHFLSEMSQFTKKSIRDVAIAINALFRIHGNTEYHSFKMSLPMTTNVHSNTIRVVCDMLAGDDFLSFALLELFEEEKLRLCIL